MRANFALVTTTLLLAALTSGCAEVELEESDAGLDVRHVDSFVVDAGVDTGTEDAEPADSDLEDAQPADVAADADVCVPLRCDEITACGEVDDGCGGTIDCGECHGEVVEIEIMPAGRLSVRVEEAIQLEVVATADDRSQVVCDVSWTSQDPTVAGVGTTGELRGRAPGIADVHAQCPGASDQIRVYVHDSDLPDPLLDPGDLAIWLRADAGLSFSGGAQVERWEDLSTNEFVVSNDTFSRHPRRISAVAGEHPVLRFGGNHELRSASYVDMSAATIFAVVENTDATHRGQILSNCGDGGNNQIRFDGSASQMYFFGENNGLDQSLTLASPTTELQVLSVSLSGSQLRVRQDGGQEQSAAVSTGGTWSFGQVGARCSSEFLEADLAEVMVYERALNDSERTQVEAYLMARYGL